ncbi:MAG TPA: DUF5666 domain-containing protein [candidate division Zixibacteria bacterium]|nr:DUF5666 domain-containing protein [candidate division Zixibacteria bacterium]
MLRRRLILPVILMLLATLVWAGPRPEYMKLKMGDAVEISGEWDRKGEVFVADDLEKLPEPRRPKLRGAVTKMLQPEKSFVLFGMKIMTDGQTEYLDNGGRLFRFEDIRVRTRLEVTCRVDEKGGWMARKIEMGKIKNSDKVKGTATRLAFDGTPPDTFEISGLKILVLEGTDLFGPWGEINARGVWAGANGGVVDAPQVSKEMRRKAK